MNTFKNIHIGVKDLSESEKLFMRNIKFNISTAEFDKMTLPELRPYRVAFSLRLRELNKLLKAVRSNTNIEGTLNIKINHKLVSSESAELSGYFDLTEHLLIDFITRYKSHITGCMNLLDYYLRKRMKEAGE